MNNKNFRQLLIYSASTGNIIFVLWVLFNAMDEGFKGTMPEKISALGLIGLLMLNCFLLLSKPTANAFKNNQTIN